MSSKRFAFLGVLVTVFLLGCSAYGQGGATGAIGGAVLDSKGTPISKAQVEIRQGAASTTVRTVFADASGNFTVASLPVDTYDVVVSATGFSTSKYNGVTVRVTETTRLNPSLSSLEKKGNAESKNRGLKKAPFIVLIGASMPSVSRLHSTTHSSRAYPSSRATARAASDTTRASSSLLCR